MRWVLLLLLILNAVFFIWLRSESGFGHLDAMASDVGPESRAKGNIALLSELDEPQPIEREQVLRECWLLGPLSGDEANITPRDGVRKVKDTVVEDADYWVFLGPFANHDEALARHRELQAKGEDSYAVSSGTLKDAVSLGVFSNEARASTHAETMRRKGYDAQIRQVGTAVERRWLLAEGEPGTASFSEQINYLKEISGGDTRLSKKNCNLIASYKEFD